MDICNKFDLHGPSCLYITGINETYTDEELTAYFKANGDIVTIVRVPNEHNQPKGRTLMQYSSERAISRLDPASLGDVQSPDDPTVTWCVRTIRQMCQEELGRELAKKCLAELSSFAGSSKAGFWDALQSELQHDQPDLSSPQSPDTNL